LYRLFKYLLFFTFQWIQIQQVINRYLFSIKLELINNHRFIRNYYYRKNIFSYLYYLDLRGVFSPPLLIADQTTTDLAVTANDRSIEYYFASDAR
jgi:hypothetical protein